MWRILQVISLRFYRFTRDFRPSGGDLRGKSERTEENGGGKRRRRAEFGLLCGDGEETREILHPRDL